MSEEMKMVHVPSVDGPEVGSGVHVAGSDFGELRVLDVRRDGLGLNSRMAKVRLPSAVTGLEGEERWIAWKALRIPSRQYVVLVDDKMTEHRWVVDIPDGAERFPWPPEFLEMRERLATEFPGRSFGAAHRAEFHG